MKKYILLVLATAAISFAGCGSGNTSDQNSDSLMTDTSVVDTMGTDSTMMPMDNTTTDTSVVQ